MQQVMPGYEFCTHACGWHSMTSADKPTLGFSPHAPPAQRIRYVWVGNALTQCLKHCSAQLVGPSGVNDGLDALFRYAAGLGMRAALLPSPLTLLFTACSSTSSWRRSRTPTSLHTMTL